MESINETTKHQNEINDKNQLILNEEIKTKLRRNTVWTKFTTILGFIVSGILIFLVVFIYFFVEVIGPFEQMKHGKDMPFYIMNFLWLIVILIAVIKIVPYIKTFKFSEMFKQFLFKNEHHASDAGISRLFKFFRFIGGLTISLFVLYLILLLVMFQVGSYNIAG